MYLFHGKGKKSGGLNVMPLDRKWLNTLENDMIVRQNREKKKKNSPKKKKVKTKSTGEEVPPLSSPSGGFGEDDASAMTQSSNTVVTFISAREGKRAEFLRSQITKDKHRKHPAGAPVGHISRELNVPTGMNANIDYNTTSQLFSLCTDQSKLLTFNNSHKRTQQMKNGVLPPLEATNVDQEGSWDRRMYPTCELFSDMTPREGGYYPDNVVSKRKEVRYKPVINKGFSIRNDVQLSVDVNNDTNDNHSMSSDITADDEQYEKLVKQLSKKGGDLSLNDLAQISKIQNPHEYMNTIFRYIHILILGFDQKRVASKRDIVNSSGGEPDAKQTLLKECSPLLLYMQHVRQWNFCFIACSICMYVYMSCPLS